MPDEFLLFVYGALGSASAELLTLYDLFGKLQPRRYRKLLRSPLWWAVVFGMLLASGFIAWAVNSGSTVTPLQPVMTGIGARGIIRGWMEAQNANRAPRLGGETVDPPTTLAEILS